MISVPRGEVPQYLRSSRLYINLFEVDDADPDNAEISIDVPADCLKLTPDIQNESDLRSLLLTARYWLIPEHIETSLDLFEFAQEEQESYRKIVLEFGQDFPFLVMLRSALLQGDVCGWEPRSTPAVMGKAVELGLLGFIKHLRAKGATWQIDARLGLNFACVAARYGHLDCLKYAHENGAIVDLTVMAHAVGYGRLLCAQFLVDSKCIDVQGAHSLCDYATRAGQIEMLKYLLSAGCVPKVSAANAAAAYDNLECLKVLHDTGCPVSPETSFHAVHCGSMQCLEYLCAIGCPWDPTTLQRDHLGRTAEACGRCINPAPKKVVAAFVFAAEHGCPTAPGSMALAASLQSLELLKMLHSRGVQVDEYTFRAATARYNVEFVRFALEHGYVCTVYDYGLAVTYDLFDGVKCLHECGVPWDDSVTSRAVWYDKPVILRYLLCHGCPVDKGAFLYAIKNDLVDCLQLLHEHGTPITEHVVYNMLTWAAVRCFQYALQQGCPYNADACVVHAARISRPCLKALHELGASMTPAVVRAALAGRQFECVAYAVTHGCQDLGPEACAAAAARKRVHALALLHKQGVRWDVTTCLSAIRSNSFECLEYAVKKGCPADTTVYAEAELQGNDATLELLHQRGIALYKGTDDAAQGDGSVLDSC